MQIIMNQYICFVALWCLVINTFIVFSSSNVILRRASCIQLRRMICSADGAAKNL